MERMENERKRAIVYRTMHFATGKISIALEEVMEGALKENYEGHCVLPEEQSLVSLK